MTLLRILILLLIVSASTVLPASDNSTQCDEYLGRAEKTLRQVSTLLKQEKERWTGLHKNPIKDEVKVTMAKGRIYVDVVIDPKVRNVINSQPITRHYELASEDPHKPLLTYIDMYAGPAWGYKVQYRPFVGAGVRPFMFGSLKARLISSFGIGAYTTVYHTGFALYFAPTSIKLIMASAFIGFDWTGKIVPGLGLGVRF